MGSILLWGPPASGKTTWASMASYVSRMIISDPDDAEVVSRYIDAPVPMQGREWLRAELAHYKRLAPDPDADADWLRREAAPTGIECISADGLPAWRAPDGSVFDRFVIDSLDAAITVLAHMNPVTPKLVGAVVGYLCQLPFDVVCTWDGDPRKTDWGFSVDEVLVEHFDAVGKAEVFDGNHHIVWDSPREPVKSPLGWITTAFSLNRAGSPDHVLHRMRKP